MEQNCACPRDFPDWHNQDVDLGGQLVHAKGIPLFLHMPLALEACVERQRQTLERLNLEECWPGLVLTQSAAFRGSILRLLKPALCPAHGLELLPSPFQLRAYLHQGDIGTISAGVKQIQQEIVREGRRPLELYLSYLTCPRCSDMRGGDKILLLRRWVESPALQKKIMKRAA